MVEMDVRNSELRWNEINSSKKYTNQEGKYRHYLIIFYDYSMKLDGKGLWV